MAEYFYYNFPKDFRYNSYNSHFLGFINMNNRESMMQEVVCFR